MKLPLDIARSTLLSPSNLQDQHLLSSIDYLTKSKVDGGDLYFQHTQQESWSLENGLIKSGGFSIDQGVGVRAVSGERSGFAYSQQLDFDSLLFAVKSARNIALESQHSAPASLRTVSAPPALYYQAYNPLASISDQDKIEILLPLEGLAKSISSAVTQVNARLESDYDIVLIVSHEGMVVADVRPMVRLQVNVIVEKNGRRETGFASEGLRGDYKRFITEDIPQRLIQESVRDALLGLEAKAAPAGTMPVVLGPGLPGILIHEAVGHGLEGDFNRKGSSAFTGKIGEFVASPLCTIVDNGTLPEYRGSLNIDDEGTQTQCTTLIQSGVLKQYMQDRLNAKLMDVNTTGNGRRESYRSLPMPRMTNTYMLPGISDPNEIISSVEKGLYAEKFSGGQVDITSGKFVFSASTAFLIEKGKLSHPVKGATLIGHGPEAMTRVSAVGNNLVIAKNGWCQKNGQTVPVSVGQPTIKIDAMTVGGTAC